MTINLPSQDDSNLIVPNWDDKIKFNKLCTTAKYLDAGISSVGHLEKYLKESGDSLAELLKDKIREIYIEEKLTGKSGDELFWSIVRKSAGKDQKMYQDAAIVIMSKYFESCDIFEEPKYSE